MERARASIDFDQLVESYSVSLVERLRGHGVTGNFLEHWVPDTDPVLGLVNLVEAAQTEGVEALDVTISRRNLPSEALSRLHAAFENLAALRVEPWGAGLRLRVDRIARAAARAAATASESAPIARRTPRREGVRSDGPKFRINPALEPAVQQLPEPAPGLAAAAAALELSVDVDDLVVEARTAATGDDLRDRLATLAAGMAIGRPRADVRDHIGALMVARLRALAAGVSVRPVEGVLLPANGGDALVEIVRLVRAACDRAGSGVSPAGAINFFDPGPSAAWRGLDDVARAARIGRALLAFVAEAGLPAGAIEFVALDSDILGNPVRVLVRVSNAIAPGEKPDLLRRVEARLKAAVEARLELHLEPLKDKNSLRRL